MWSYVRFVLGIFLMLASVAGTISVISGDAHEAGRRIVEGGIDTMGVIEKREEVTVAARYRKIGGIGRYYTMTYSFTTLEGVKYSSEINISKDQAYAVSDGDQIRVRYYKDQPSINSALGFKEYMSAEDAENVPMGTILFSALLMLLGGAWLTWSSWRHIRPERASVSTDRVAGDRMPSPSPSPNRTGAVARPAGGRMFGGR